MTAPNTSHRHPEVCCHTPCATQTGAIAYTIATLVNNRDQYDEMVLSFCEGGFAEGDCEFLYIDNTGNDQVCAYRGLNAMLNAARGRQVILCHQDVHLLADGRINLDTALDDLETLDPDWALAGNAGGIAPGRLALRITDPHGADQHVGKLPARVMSLDENFIVVRANARLGFSRNLSGFHFYGADICLNADIMGWNAYVVDFHLAHLSGGNKNHTFNDMESAFRAKWSRALTPRWMQTTCALMRLTGDKVGQIASQVTTRPYKKISRLMATDGGWNKPAPSAAIQKKSR